MYEIGQCIFGKGIWLMIGHMKWFMLFECIDVGISCYSIFEDRWAFTSLTQIFLIDIFMMIMLYRLEIAIVSDSRQNRQRALPFLQLNWSLLLYFLNVLLVYMPLLYLRLFLLLMINRVIRVRSVLVSQLFSAFWFLDNVLIAVIEVVCTIFDAMLIKFGDELVMIAYMQSIK